MNLLRTVQRTIQRYNLLQSGEIVVAGVSGGPDSLCLLHVLAELAPALRLDLHVAHLHHGLRDADADADAEFVQQTAAAWRLPCTVERVDVTALAEPPGISLEEAARIARYGFLGRLAADLGASTIAVGHTADDQAETVLMHWLRGSGLAGLRGMTPTTHLSDLRLDAPNSPFIIPNSSFIIHLIRPLLFVTRADVLAYCAEHRLEPRFDRSNEDTTFFRNRLRHELLPLLETYNPQIRRILANNASVIAADYDLLREHLLNTWPEVVVQETAEQLIFDLARWRALPTSLQRSFLREAVNRLRRSLLNVNFVHVENALWALREGDTGTRITLPAGLELVMGYTRFAIGDAGLELPIGDVPQLEQERLALALPGVTPLLGAAGWRAEAALLPRADLPAGWQANPDPWQAWLDAEVIGPTPWLRTRREGDRFQPFGLAGRSKLLAEFFTSAKAPAAARERWPLLIAASGDIAWVCGLRLDERAKVSEATQRVVHVRFGR